jgi:transposase-like protein
VARLLPPESSSVEQVSREVGVSAATLERWRAGALAHGSGDRTGGSQRWTAAARLQALITTAGMVAAAAIDIGARIHVAAVGPDRDPEPVRTFNTFTNDLHRLADWFARCGIKTVLMESTGVYWIPIFEILEQRGFEVMVVNARDATHVPGRKTDVSDAQWLKRLHEYGLLRASFRPQAEMAALRACHTLRLQHCRFGRWSIQ